MKRTLFIVGILLIIVVAGTSIIPDSAEKVLERLESKGIRAESLLSNYQNGKQVHIISIGDSSNEPLLLIHGSPGDWSAWENIIANDSIRDKYYILAIDRAGYGLTSVQAQTQLYSQASVIESALEAIGITSNITVVGHSYGAAVAEQLLVNHSENYALAIFIAGTLSPELMEPRWYNKIATWSIVNAILPKDLIASNYEMMGLPESLGVIEPGLNKITTPIVYIQGDSDVLVPFETAAYYKKVKKDGVDYVLLKDVNHFIPWTDPTLITNILLDMNKD